MMPLPQIVIEDPEGEVQCDECCKKSGDLKRLTEDLEKVKIQTVKLINLMLLKLS